MKHSSCCWVVGPEVRSAPLFLRFGHAATGKVLKLLLAVSLQALTTQAAVHYQILRSFGFPDLGAEPEASLIQGSDGALYGTTYAGGKDGGGTVFRMNRDGSGHTVLHHFSGASDDGLYPTARLLEASDGMLYGTTSWGGSNQSGAVFKLNKDGTGFEALLSFEARSDNQPTWQAGLIEGSDGVLYRYERREHYWLWRSWHCV